MSLVVKNVLMCITDNKKHSKAIDLQNIYLLVLDSQFGVQTLLLFSHFEVVLWPWMESINNLDNCSTHSIDQ